MYFASCVEGTSFNKVFKLYADKQKS